MLQNVDRSKLDQMKASAQEAVQDIEQLQKMLFEDDTYENVIIFKNVLHECTMSCLNVTALHFEVDKQVEQGTHFETSRLKWEAEHPSQETTLIVGITE
jgi:hypothetical protein